MKLIPLIAVLAIAIGCQKAGKAPEAKTDEQKAFYSLGSMLGSRFKDLDLSDEELALVQAGLADSARGKKPNFDTQKFQFKIQEIFQGRMKKKVDNVKGDGTKYLETFKKEEGVKTTASGLAYKVVKEGSGAMPKATDEVEVHYHGTLIDGTVFDSSVERGKTVKFPLNRVIKGWTEGLQLVKEGGKIRLVIPSDLGYGDSGAPPKIPGGSTLIFDVELFKVNPAKDEAPAKGKKK